MGLAPFTHAGCLVLLAALMAGASRAGEPALAENPPVQKEVLGSLPKCLKAGTLQISPDGKHFAGAMMHGDKWTVYVDGVESAEYDAVTDDSIHFSPDSKRVAYGATRAGKGIVVMDGKELPSGLACAKGFPIFDATGKHLLYVAAQVEDQASVIMDGQESKTWKALLKGGPVFSADGSHFVYVAKDGDGARAVVDGIAGPVYENIVAPVFGPDCKHLAYVALTPNASILVVDGEELITTDNFVRDSFAFDSPTRLHILSIDNRSKITRWQLDLAVPAHRQ